jgi:hypothetical protein
MSCEKELYALQRAQRELDRFRKEHFGAPDAPAPTEAAAGSATTEVEASQRLAELTATLAQKRDAYGRCLRAADDHADIESLMRDSTGAPLGGGAGPPM